MNIDIKSLSYRDIRSITDVETLEEIVFRLDTDVERIKAQLEYPAEDETIEWETRAIHALANKRALRNRAWTLLDRMAGKTGVSIIPQEVDYEAKTKLLLLKEEISAKNRAENLEQQKLALEKERLKREIQSRSDTYFRQFASRFLTREQLLECGQAAEAQAMAYIAAHKENQI